MYSVIKKIEDEWYVKLPSNRIGEVELMDGDKVSLRVNKDSIEIFLNKDNKERSKDIALDEDTIKLLELLDRGFDMGGEYKFKRADAYE